MRLNPFVVPVVLLLHGASTALAAQADPEVLEEVVVTATLREQTLLDTPVSITVLNDRTLQDAGRQHFEDVLAAVPNLNWAGGTSRPRFSRSAASASARSTKARRIRRSAS